MAIINNANPGSQLNLLCLIYRVLNRNSNKYSLEELYSLCRPEELLWVKDHKKRFRENFNFWQKPGWQLWDEDAQQKIYILEPIDGEVTPDKVANIVRRKFFQNIDEQFMEPDNKEVAQLFRGLAFILSAELFAPFKGSAITRENLDSKIRELFNDYPLNDSEKSYFLEYCHFLGFLEIKSSSEYVVDPTKAVKSVLPYVFENKKQLEIKSFIDSLSEYLPVLDGGFYKTRVEKYLNERHGISFNHKRISPALSHALQRVSHEGGVRFESLSDDRNGMILNTPIASHSVSIIHYNGEIFDAK